MKNREIYYPKATHETTFKVPDKSPELDEQIQVNSGGETAQSAVPIPLGFLALSKAPQELFLLAFRIQEQHE